MTKDKPKFEVGTTVKVPHRVCDKGEGRIVGLEWGPDNNRLKHRSLGWVYWIRFPTSEEWWSVSEQELEQWQS